MQIEIGVAVRGGLKLVDPDFSMAGQLIESLIGLPLRLERMQ